MNKNKVSPTIFGACILYCTINRNQLRSADGQRHAYIRSFPALCGKKAQQQEKKSAAKIDVLASKNTNHVWDEIDSTYSTRLSKWNTGNSAVAECCR
jgi:hypothetical protein